MHESRPEPLNRREIRKPAGHGNAGDRYGRDRPPFFGAPPFLAPLHTHTALTRYLFLLDFHR